MPRNIFDPNNFTSQRTPVAARPSAAQQRGFSKKSALQILTENISSDQGFFSSLLGVPSRIPRFIAEGVAEGGQIVGETGPGQFIGDVAGAIGTIPGRLAEDVSALVPQVTSGFRKITGAGPAPEEKGPVLGPAAPTPSDKERFALQAAQESFQGIEDLDQLESENLTPEGQATVARIREQYEKQLADTNRQITSLNLQGSMQQRMGHEIMQEMFPKGLIPGADPKAMKELNQLLDRAVEGGSAGTASNIQAIIDSIVDSNLPEDEKLERLGFINEQADTRKELQGAIDGLVTDRQAIQEILNSPDAALIGDPSMIAQPQLHVDAQFDVIGRNQVALMDEIEPLLEATFGTVIPPAVVDQLTNVENTGLIDQIAMGLIDPNTDQFAGQIAAILPGVDVNAVQSAVEQGLEIAGVRHEAFDTALDQNQYEASSMQLVYAIFQAALGAGLDAPTAGAMAEDANIHKIIDVMSEGRVGAQGTDGRAGLGMLTPEAYERVGLPNAVGDPTAELEALILYMMEAGGSPAKRLLTFFETGVWGN